MTATFIRGSWCQGGRGDRGHHFEECPAWREGARTLWKEVGKASDRGGEGTGSSEKASGRAEEDLATTSKGHGRAGSFGG